MKGAVHTKTKVLGVVASAIAIVGFTIIGLAIAEKGPFSKKCNSGTSLLSGAPEPAPPAGRPINIAAELALRRRGLPPELVGEILSNGNEWKDMKFAFNQTPQTANLLDLIDRYGNALLAAQGGNGYYGTGFSMEIDNNGRIIGLKMWGLTDADIRDLSFLPKSLRVLSFLIGSIKHINLSQLPRGLESVNLKSNQISETVIESVPPSLRTLTLYNNPLKQGISFKTPLPDGLQVYFWGKVPLDLDGGQENEYGVVTWENDLSITLVRGLRY